MLRSTQLRFVARYLAIVAAGLAPFAAHAQNSGSSGGNALMGLFFLGTIGFLYFLPLIVAAGRGHTNMLAIGVLNLLLGWTMIGWVVAMVWACTNQTKATS